MKKSLFTLVAALALIVPASAYAKGYESIVMTLTNSQTLALQGGTEMTASIDGEYLRFQRSPGLYFIIGLDEVKSWVYSAEPGEAIWTSNSDIKVSPDVVITETATDITISNLPDNSTVTLTNLSGITVKSINASGSCTITYSDLTPGMYLLTFNNQTIKIAVNR